MNKAIASVRANPKIAILNNSSFNDGFLEIPKTNALNTAPIPIPAPANPIVAKPAPINLADCGTINHIIWFYILWTELFVLISNYIFKK